MHNIIAVYIVEATLICLCCLFQRSSRWPPASSSNLQLLPSPQDARTLLQNPVGRQHRQKSQWNDILRNYCCSSSRQRGLIHSRVENLKQLCRHRPCRLGPQSSGDTSMAQSDIAILQKLERYSPSVMVSLGKLLFCGLHEETRPPLTCLSLSFRPCLQCLRSPKCTRLAYTHIMLAICIGKVLNLCDLNSRRDGGVPVRRPRNGESHQQGYVVIRY